MLPLDFVLWSRIIVMLCDYYLENPHPGPILEEEFFQPYGVSHEEFAEATQMAVEDIDKLVNACCSVTADMDVRLTRFWGMLEGFKATA